MIRPLGRAKPQVPATAFVHPSAELIGRVRLGRGVSIWPGAVLRGDIEPIAVGEGSNIQDNAVLHTDHGVPTVVGRYVTVGHGAILHSCRVGDGALIGLGAILLSGSVIGKGALVGAGSLVSPGTRIPAGHLALGRPARTVRPLSVKEKSGLKKNALRYIVYARRHKQSLS
jgi:carbonic anhydrase/acetyltransferase-like protein (isoleucine patch superfamily)